MAGQSGHALSFNGIDNSVAIPASDSLASLTGSYTVSLTFKYNGAGNSGHIYWTLIARNSTGSGYNDPFHLWVTSWDRHVQARIGNGSSEYYLDSAVAIDDGQYHTVALVYDAVGKTCQLFLDGQLRATQALPTDWTMAAGSGPVTLGTWSPYADAFNGVIDDVRIYSRALGQGELAQAIAGPVADHRTYDSFGRLTGQTNSAVDFAFGYAGRPWDADTGLSDHRARWYDPSLGRFLNEDPSGFDGGDANLYRYCGNNPLVNNDPSGLCWQGSGNVGSRLSGYTNTLGSFSITSPAFADMTSSFPTSTAISVSAAVTERLVSGFTPGPISGLTKTPLADYTIASQVVLGRLGNDIDNISSGVMRELRSEGAAHNTQVKRGEGMVTRSLIELHRVDGGLETLELDREWGWFSDNYRFAGMRVNTDRADILSSLVGENINEHLKMEHARWALIQMQAGVLAAAPLGGLLASGALATAGGQFMFATTAATSIEQIAVGGTNLFTGRTYETPIAYGVARAAIWGGMEQQDAMQLGRLTDAGLAIAPSIVGSTQEFFSPRIPSTPRFRLIEPNFDELMAQGRSGVPIGEPSPLVYTNSAFPGRTFSNPQEMIDAFRVQQRINNGMLLEAPGAVANGPNRIYSSRVLLRSAEESGPFHNFPESFNQQIFDQGTRTVTPNFWRTPKTGLGNDSIMYRLPGSVNGVEGTFEIGVRPSVSGNTEVIMHRFFRPNP